MKKNLTFLTCILSSFALSCFAVQDEETYETNPAQVAYDAHPHRLYIGPSISWYNNSYSNDEGQNGPMYGGITGYDYLKNNTIYAGAHFNYLAGKLVGDFGDNFSQEIWTEGRIGYRFSLDDKKTVSLAPFTGYGYFVFLQDLNPETFRYRFMYIPLGFKATWQAASFLEMGLNAMGGIPFASKWSVSEKNTGNTRITAYVELPFRFFLTESRMFDLSIAPYWRNWSIRSDGSLIGQVSNIVGAEVQFGFNL